MSAGRSVSIGVMSRRAICAAAIMLGISMGAAMAQNDDRGLIEATAQNDAAAVALMLKADVNVDQRNERRQTALLVATHANNVELARMLIEAGADVNAKDGINDSPYLYAGARGHLEILKLTLSHGADLKSTNHGRRCLKRSFSAMVAPDTLRSSSFWLMQAQI